MSINPNQPPRLWVNSNRMRFLIVPSTRKINAVAKNNMPNRYAAPLISEKNNQWYPTPVMAQKIDTIDAIDLSAHSLREKRRQTAIAPKAAANT